MKLTNNAGLPDAIVRAMEASPYSRGDAFASVTELASPTQLAMLRRLHSDAITEDAADRIWSLLGTLMHALLSQAADANVLHEERLVMTLPSGLTMSGQMDSYTLDNGGKLRDWKLTTVWSTVKDVKPEWLAQANGYASLLRAHGFPVASAEVVLVLRDWSLPEALRKAGEGWPQQAVAVRPVALQRAGDAVAWFDGRARALKAALDAKDALVCTAEERWQKPDRFAAIKAGAKRATKLFDDKADAVIFALNKGLEVVDRPGESTRCMDFDGRGYCPVRGFCSFAQALRGDSLFKESEDV